jgi:hypothetical protein
MQQRSEWCADASGIGNRGGGPLGINARPGVLPAGFDKNLVASVGGFMDWGIGPGATASTAQVMQQDLGRMGPGSSPFAEGNSLGGAFASAKAKGFTDVWKMIFPDRQESLIGGGMTTADFTDNAEKKATEFDVYLTGLSQKALDAGIGLKAIRPSGEGAAKAIDNTYQAFKNLNGSLAEEMRNQRVAITGPDGKPISSAFQAAQFLQAQATPTATPQELIDANERTRQAAIHQAERQGQIQRQITIPANIAMQYLASPMTPYGQSYFTEGMNKGASTGQIPTQSGVGTGLGKQDAKFLPKGLKAGFAAQQEAYSSTYASIMGDADPVAAQERLNAKTLT